MALWLVVYAFRSISFSLPFGLQRMYGMDNLAHLRGRTRLKVAASIVILLVCRGSDIVICLISTFDGLGQGLMMRPA